MFLLRKEYFGSVDDLIKSIRSFYPCRKSTLREMVYEARKSMVRTSSELIEAADLEDGKRYGQFEVSEMATAFERRTRNELKYHGDVYVTVWTWEAELGCFTCKSAWGGITMRKPAQMSAPLIELP